eukprot:CAMPEP_0168317924 /NCGR_PEP_ID=MMETSP0213-20121227/171_1 /TAXON_ID=151035 /ORGANISM="Euplotes harpa, Strain FSP1.4" /LENGTH=245 /DNA_ID=CAMNT_0008318889 /DNA_START=14 /DNA_END=751 /DNA_ORIENTATION=+
MRVSQVIVCLMGISVILNSAIAIVGPFFPPEAEKNGVDLKTVGYILSAYPMAFVTVSLIMPTVLFYVSQRAVFVAGCILYALSVAGFGSIIFLNKTNMIICGLVFRVLQGSANAALYTTSYSIFSMKFDGNEFMKINSIFKGTIGIGLLLGLLIGTILYIIGGYFLPFVVFSTFMLAVTPFVAKIIPSKASHEESKIMTKRDGADSQHDIEECVEDKGGMVKATAPNFVTVRRQMNPFRVVCALI